MQPSDCPEKHNLSIAYFNFKIFTFYCQDKHGENNDKIYILTHFTVPPSKHNYYHHYQHCIIPPIFTDFFAKKQMIIN